MAATADRRCSGVRARASTLCTTKLEMRSMAYLPRGNTTQHQSKPPNVETIEGCANVG
jgi:hypothetical protein